MKIKSQRSNRTLLLSLLVLAIILACIVVAWFFYFDKKQPQQPTTDTPTAPTRTESTQQSQPKPEDKSTTNTDTPKTPAETKPGTKTTYQMSINASAVSGKVYIRGGIDNAVVSTGECSAVLSGPNGESKQIATTLLQNPTTTDCKTITIDSGTLAKGKWTARLQYTSDTAEGRSNETTFEL